MKPQLKLIFAIFALSFNTAFSQQDFTVEFKHGSFLPEANTRQTYIDSFNVQYLQSGKQFAIFQFYNTPSQIDRNTLLAGNIEILEFISNKTYTVSISGPLSAVFLNRVGVRSVFMPQPEMKMDAFLANKIYPSWAVKNEGTIETLISFPKTFSLQQVSAELNKRNLRISNSDYQAYRILGVSLGIAQIQELAAQPFVEYMQVAPPPDQPLNNSSISGSRANVLNTSVADGGRGLNGDGVVIGVGDNADVQTHFDFYGRNINRSPGVAGGHGHHVAGTAGGAGNINELHKGYASKSTIITQAFSGILRNAGVYIQDHGMVITNNSYGNVIDCEYNGFYDLLSKAVDQMAIDYPYLSNVFASGNSGHITCPPFLPGFRTVLGSYQSAKNSIVVGATTDSGEVAFFSSRGPVMDGRMKPEITAMGLSVISAWPTNGYSYNNGTSMAAPGVSGGLALLYQRYRQLHGGSDPKNGLMKAILSNGATDRGNTGPDYKNGFGWMNLLRSVQMIENNWFIENDVADGGQENHVVNVPANTAQLKVLLYWNDPAGSLLSNKALVNDLDLSVVTPSAATVLPLILDTNRLNMDVPAVNGNDRLNNIEQVVINNPVAGNYTLKVAGFEINENPSQEYFLVYDIVPVQLEITGPAASAKLRPGTNTKISWEVNGLSPGFVDIDLSVDNGMNWTNIAGSVNIENKILTWAVPNLATGEARIRIRRQSTNETTVSEPFVILGSPVISLHSVQCEGYININWTAIAGATDYELMILSGDEMKPVATTTANNYVFSGLSKDSTYLVSVRARINGKPGLRAFGQLRKPDSGNCTGTISDNDLKLASINSPYSGRAFTSRQPGANSPVSISIKNLDDAAVNNFTVSYSLNGGAWISEAVNTPLAGGAVYEHIFSSTIDLSTIGNYHLRVAVDNAIADPVKNNDTLAIFIRHLENNPLDLTSTFRDDLETLDSMVYLSDTTGLFGVERYDFSRTAAIGRLRSFVNSGIAYSGSKAITLDAVRNLVSGNTNYLYGTYNLENYNVATDDVRLDFQYLNHGQKDHADNKVWIRGSDTDAWIEVYDLYANQLIPGSYTKTASIELSNLLSAASQDFSSSFQVRWGQNGTTSASDQYTGAGYTFDDIRLYRVTDDVQMISIDAPLSGCNLNMQSVVVTVRNSSSNTLNSIPVKYRINGGSWVEENIASIPAHTNFQYQFLTQANITVAGNNLIEAVVNFASDDFNENDSVSTEVRNLPSISSFPYLENFEQGEGHWYTGGFNASWQFGKPASYKTKKAASGDHAWMTNLNSVHYPMELSYLYSPCFNIGGMTAPTLSFSLSLDIEDCGSSICDAAWVEYSEDGIVWTKLGTSGSGTNWYNKPGFDVWAQQNFNRWHVATTPLPSVSIIRLRFVFKSDEGLEREGIAVDDIHIYDNTLGIYDGMTMASPVSATLNGNNWIDITESGKLVASVHPNNQSLGNTNVQTYIFDGAVRNNGFQYYHNRNLVIQPSVIHPADSVSVRFYFLETETDTLLKASGCSGCTKPGSAYELGVSKYSDPVLSFENGTIADNQQGMWNFISPQHVAIVPFDKGYYAEFKVKDFSEFWLNNGWFNNISSLPVKLLDFKATRIASDVLLTWKVATETDVNSYEIEVARGNTELIAGNFEMIGSVPGLGNSNEERSYNFMDMETGKTGKRYYRVKLVDEDGSFSYTPVRMVGFDEVGSWLVYPNPSNGLFHLNVNIAALERVELRLFDAKGRLVKKDQLIGTGMMQQHTIDLRAGMYASGLYMLQISTGDTTRSLKLYKQ